MILEPKKVEEWTNRKELYTLHPWNNIIRMMKSRRITYAGFLGYMGEIRNKYEAVRTIWML